MGDLRERKTYRVVLAWCLFLISIPLWYVAASNYIGLRCGATELSLCKGLITCSYDSISGVPAGIMTLPPVENVPLSFFFSRYTPGSTVIREDGKEYPLLSWRDRYGFRMPRFFHVTSPVLRDSDLTLVVGGVIKQMDLELPLWIPVLMTGFFLIVTIRNNRRSIRNYCPKCSYNLFGNISGVCPECGTLVTNQQRKALKT